MADEQYESHGKMELLQITTLRLKLKLVPSRWENKSENPESHSKIILLNEKK